jgi:hypothetical protein
VQLPFEVAESPEVPSEYALSNVRDVPFTERVTDVTVSLSQLTGDARVPDEPETVHGIAHPVPPSPTLVTVIVPGPLPVMRIEPVPLAVSGVPGIVSAKVQVQVPAKELVPAPPVPVVGLLHAATSAQERAVVTRRFMAATIPHSRRPRRRVGRHTRRDKRLSRKTRAAEIESARSRA